MVALHYSVLHRFETFSAPGKITHGSIRLPPRNLASSRGCSLAIIFANIRASKSTYYLLYDKAHSKTHNYNSIFQFCYKFYRLHKLKNKENSKEVLVKKKKIGENRNRLKIQEKVGTGHPVVIILTILAVFVIHLCKQF